VSDIIAETQELMKTLENSSEINETVRKLKNKMSEAEEEMKQGNYAAAKERMDEVQSLYSDLRKKIKKKEGEGGLEVLWIAVGVVVIVVIGLLIYLLMPPKEGYHHEKGYQYREPGTEDIKNSAVERIKETVERIKKKLGMEEEEGYRYTG
ncbi:MAG: hypothetical protein ABEJ72_00435, partial [Candidatus Aenigmatarchaeota archaeon]